MTLQPYLIARASRRRRPRGSAARAPPAARRGAISLHTKLINQRGGFASRLQHVEDHADGDGGEHHQAVLPRRAAAWGPRRAYRGPNSTLNSMSP
jgi:hypothetical protein